MQGCLYRRPWAKLKNSRRPLSPSLFRSAYASVLVTDILSSPSLIAKSNLQTIQSALGDGKLAKQLQSAAKRVSKKRSSEESTLPKESSSKRKKQLSNDEKCNDAEVFERSFCIPERRAERRKNHCSIKLAVNI